MLTDVNWVYLAAGFVFGSAAYLAWRWKVRDWLGVQLRWRRFADRRESGKTVFERQAVQLDRRRQLELDRRLRQLVRAQQARREQREATSRDE